MFPLSSKNRSHTCPNKFLQYPFLLLLLFYFLLFCFWPCCTANEIVVPWPGIEPTPSPLEAWSLNHWTTKSPIFHFKIAFTFINTIRNIGHQQTQEPGTVSNMEQSFSYINYRKQGRELYKKTKSVLLLRSDISLYYTLNIFDISPMLFKNKQLN